MAEIVLRFLIRIIRVLFLNESSGVIGILTKHEDFPKGHEPSQARPIKFLHGAAAIALQSRIKILHVVIGRSPATLTKHGKWYQIPQINLL